MKMSNKLREITEEITFLKEKNAQYLKNKKISALSPDNQLKFCRNNKKIGRLSYEAYQLLMNKNHFNEAADYFYLSYVIGYQKPINEMRSTREKKAESTLKEEKISGSSEELFNQGICYLLGIGKNQNRANAILFFKKAVQLKHEDAQCILALLYEYGEGVKESNEKALNLYQVPAEEGYAIAQKHLGTIYKFGYGVKKSIEKAVEWYLLAAEQGDAKAQTMLGMQYYYDYDAVEKDYKKAFHWFKWPLSKDSQKPNCIWQ